ncbi:efflux RND transporter periplasmic adaptor subunit [bacterium]|nr:efflux RND transporter periplasmic adaptor subunit [bacterium]
MKKIYIVLVIITLLLSCTKSPREEKGEEIVPVHVALIETKELSFSIRTVGIIASEQTVKLAFKIGGIIREIKVDGGDRVKKGQVLAELDLYEINAHVSKAKVALDKAERDFDRAQSLFQDSVITKALYQDAESALEAARSDYRIAIFNKEHAIIKAPSDGVILMRLQEENEVIGAGMPVVVFGSTEKNWVVKAGISDRDLVNLQYGDSAVVNLDAFQGKIITGNVSRLSEAPSMETGLFEVEVQLENPPDKISTGMIAKAEIFPEKKEAYTIIPIEAIAEADKDSAYVYLVDPNSNVSKVPVHIVRLEKNYVAASTIIPEGAKVVTSGTDQLQDGSKINILDKTGAK